MASKYRRPRQGQNAPARNLTLDDLNRDERKVFFILRSADQSLKLREIARRAFKLRPNTYMADYRTRNALRRPVRERLVEHVARGEYVLARRTRDTSPVPPDAEPLQSSSTT